MWLLENSYEHSALHSNSSHKEASTNISFYFALANEMLGDTFKVSKNLREKNSSIFFFNLKISKRNSYP